MKMCLITLVFLFIYLIETESISQNNTAILISKYAKVAHWGANENNSNVQEGRSVGQSLWTHGSDVNIISGQNVKSDKPKVAYHYAVYKNPVKKIDDAKNEKLPAVGEVIQDRFNPRPYFNYGQIAPKPQKTETYSGPVQKPNADSVPTPPAISYDSFSATAPPLDLYTSPYSSYNPPEPKPNNHASSFSYPPTQDFYAPPPPPPDADQDTYDYQPKVPEDSPKTSYSTLSPPLSFHYGSGNDDSGDMSPEDDNHEVDAPPSDYMGNHQNDGPPNYPPKSEDDIYYPYDAGKGEQDMTVDHPPKDYKSPPPPPPPSMTMDLSPPPSDDHGSHFPQYLYDGHHYDHHVYEEVPHTTTEATEDKRVSSGHYSYYYLGRKLWYVPLYFSIYFIIYVTVLILKAIARHKIQHKHKWAGSVRDARQLTSDSMDTIDYMHRNITNAIDNARKIYATFSM